MDKKQRIRFSGHKNQGPGIETGILDCNDNIITTGDTVVIMSCDYTGVVLYDHETNSYGIYFGKWYGDNDYDTKSYGKFIELKKDNGMKLDLKIIKFFNNKENKKYGYVI